MRNAGVLKQLRGIHLRHVCTLTWLPAEILQHVLVNVDVNACVRDVHPSHTYIYARNTRISKLTFCRNEAWAASHMDTHIRSQTHARITGRQNADIHTLSSSCTHTIRNDSCLSEAWSVP
jgi:hypothetical protein